MYDVAGYELYQQRSTQIWNVNWKVAWDNYLENYHIPLGHPGPNRLLRETDDWEELESGVSYGMFEVRDKLSKIPEERQYQELFHLGCERVPEELRGLWVQFGLAGNLGIDFYPELVDIFQLVPLAVDKTLVVALYYGHRNPTPEEQELRRLNVLINDSVNEEDRQLCTRVQQGLRSYGYSPGPLSQQESGVFAFHEMLRRLIPVASLTEAPAPGTLASENSRLLAQA
jgi:phenylpropionate dioxygenase-like ring-hydroxylating dioxygenase large terminal subunit